MMPTNKHEVTIGLTERQLEILRQAGATDEEKLSQILSLMAHTITADIADEIENPPKDFQEKMHREMVKAVPEAMKTLRRHGVPIGVRGSGFVYFIQSEETKEIKIGFSKNVRNRMSTLQTSSASTLVLLGSILGSKTAEQAYHQRFAQHRLRGEWFSPDQSILDEIARINGDHV